MRFLIFTLLIYTSMANGLANTIDVRLFSTATLTQSWVSARNAPFFLITIKNEKPDTVCVLDIDSLPKVLHVNFASGKMRATYANKELGEFLNLELIPKNDSGSFVVKGKGRERIYSGALIFKPNGREIYLINRVDLEQYVAGVVESEGGHVNHYEYFKAQAVLARTWALRNMKKHLKEGYNVKDDVTSQAYYSKAYLQHSQEIVRAVRETADTILVDEEGNVVFGAFHANSGGETVNSEDVWQGTISYLRAAPDTFSLAGEKAFWDKRLNKEKFIGFFARKLAQNSSDSAFRAAVLGIDQEQRMPFFEYKGRRLKMRWVRENFGLRSTFFTVVDEGETVRLKGRGFGHGIGMSQEGAMRMAELGFGYKQILEHYFKGVQFTTIPEQAF